MILKPKDNRSVWKLIMSHHASNIKYFLILCLNTSFIRNSEGNTIPNRNAHMNKNQATKKEHIPRKGIGCCNPINDVQHTRDKMNMQVMDKNIIANIFSPTLIDTKDFSFVRMTNSSMLLIVSKLDPTTAARMVVSYQ